MIINHKSDYKEKRREAYPPIGDQLDAVYKLALALQSSVELPPEVQNWINQLTTVKDTYKKT